MKKEYLKTLMAGIIGGIAGYFYYQFVGCNGSCPISGNPFSSTIFGLIAGILIGLPQKKKTDLNN